jgi:hypothetical protein
MAVSIRGTGIQASVSASYTVPWPSGTITGDTAVIFIGQAWPMNPPSGWTVNSNLTGGWWDGGVISKVLTAADITAGSVTITFAGTAFSGVIAILTTVGSCKVTQTVASQTPSPGSASVTLNTTATFPTDNLVCYFGSNRAVDTVTVNRGTLRRSATDSVNGSGALYTETGITTSTAVFNYPIHGDGNYQAIVVIANPLTLACAGGATLSSSYFVTFLSRTDIASGDLPPIFNASLAGVSTLTAGIATWGLGPSLPAPANGTWSPTVTYATGDTVASSQYAIKTAAGAVLAPLTYRSLQNGNLGHNPDNYEGFWTCITQPPHNEVANKNFVPVPFGYALSPLPTKTTLAAAEWQAGLGHSLSWSVTPPGDVVQLLDQYIILNYLAGSSIVRVVSRPLAHSASTGNQGLIVNPGTNAQFQCWFTSGLSTTPYLTLNQFEPKIVDGMQPDGTVGASYLTAIVASGGTTPYVYGIIAGQLPPGVSLDPATGVISGTPQASGIFEFTAQVTDAVGTTAQTTCAAPISCGTTPAAGRGNSFY